jgi:hypothetical protein
MLTFHDFRQWQKIRGLSLLENYTDRAIAACGQRDGSLFSIFGFVD